MHFILFDFCQCVLGLTLTDKLAKMSINKIGTMLFPHENANSDEIEEFKKTVEDSATREQEDNIQKILERRKIKYLVHFTRVENLSSILEHGLIPVEIQEQRGIVSIHNDDQRIDSKLDCTSCSVGFPNYRLFYSFREHKYPGNKWVIIILDKDVLLSSNNIAYYCHTNAARVLPGVKSDEELCTAKSFENMFRESTHTRDIKSIQRKDLNIPDNYTTDPQAEVLISDIIAPNYIARVCFNDKRDINEYIEKNSTNLLNNYDYQVDSDFFSARKDYKFWKKENLNG